MFIYVFSNHDKNILLSEGYQMIKEDNFGSVYVFVMGTDNAPQNFDCLDRYVVSNVLSF